MVIYKYIKAQNMGHTQRIEWKLSHLNKTCVLAWTICTYLHGHILFMFTLIYLHLFVLHYHNATSSFLSFISHNCHHMGSSVQWCQYLPPSSSFLPPSFKTKGLQPAHQLWTNNNRGPNDCHVTKHQGWRWARGACWTITGISRTHTVVLRL